MHKLKRRIFIVLTVPVLLASGSSAAFASIDLGFLQDLAPLASRIPGIDADVLNSGLSNLRAAQQIFRDRSPVEGVRALATGALGLPELDVSRVASGTDIGKVTAIIDRNLADQYYRSTQAQQLATLILGKRGQREQGEELAKSEAFKQTAIDTIDVAQSTTDQSAVDAQQVREAAANVYQYSQQAQGARSSQRILKAVAAQLNEMAAQNEMLSSQATGTSSGLTSLSAQISTLAGQGQIQTLQQQRLVALGATQTRSMERLYLQMTAANLSRSNRTIQDATAAERSSEDLGLPNLTESYE